MSGTLDRHRGVGEYNGVRYEIVIDHWHGGSYTIYAVEVPGLPPRPDHDGAWDTFEEAVAEAHLLARSLIGE